MRGKRHQDGMTLVELIMVIGIVFTFVLVAMGFYNKAKEGGRVSDSTQNLTAVVSAIRDAFSSQGNYTGLQNSVVMKLNAFPDAMQSTGTNIKHPWKSDGVTITSTTVNSTDDSFRIQFDDVPEKSCNALVSGTYRSFDRVTVNGTSITGVANTATSCAAGGDTNRIIWTAH